MALSDPVPESDAFFNPNAIALIGASASPTRIGGRTLASLLKHGFAGRLYPINPSHEIIQGLQAYARIEDVPEPVDLVIIAVPAAGVLGALHSCVAKGVRAVVIYSSGFAEAGGDGVSMQAAIRSLPQLGDTRFGAKLFGLYELAFQNHLHIRSGTQYRPSERWWREHR